MDDKDLFILYHSVLWLQLADDHYINRVAADVLAPCITKVTVAIL